MLKMNENDLAGILAAIRRTRVLVVGDIMIDQYWMGTVNRISPEAPIPVVRITEETEHLGGAANVANNIVALGAAPYMVGVTGADTEARLLARTLKKRGISPEYLVTDPGRPTTTKTRIIGQTQHMVRVDREDTVPLRKKAAAGVLSTVKKLLPKVDAVILEDYNKGLFSDRLIRDVISAARRKGKIVTVDPKFENFTSYEGATVFKPNRKEIADALGRNVTDDNLAATCGELRRRMKLGCVLVTLGKDGMAFLEKGKKLARISTAARKVYDVSGAGDTVIATLTCCLAAGYGMHEAVQVATYAAGAVIAEVGVVPATRDMIMHSFRHHDAD